MTKEDWVVFWRSIPAGLKALLKTLTALAGLIKVYEWCAEKWSAKLPPKLDMALENMNALIPSWMPVVIALLALVGWLVYDDVRQRALLIKLTGREPRRAPLATMQEFARVARQLGLGEISPSGLQQTGFSHAIYDGGIVLWAGVDKRFVILSDAEDSITLEKTPVYETDEKWFYNVPFLRERTGVHEPANPPVGGLAQKWAKNPAKWKWLGGLVKHVHYPPGQVFFAQYEKGEIYGPVPANGEVNLVVVKAQDVEIRPVPLAAPATNLPSFPQPIAT
jgi:hypothetical protein